MNETLIFLHIPKTAGTTFAFILEQNFARSGVARVYQGSGLSERQFEALPESRRAALDCVMGHFDFGLHRLIPRPARYATFLRHPVKQVLSRYDHILSSRWHPLHHMARQGASIEDLVSRLPDNDQTRTLCGLELQAGRPHPVLDERHLAQAKEHLKEHFVLVGITERFDESVLLAQQRCGLRTVRYVRRNVRDKNRREAPLPEGARRMIEARTGFDLALYEWADARMERTISEMGEPFQQELGRFRAANARYSKLAGPLRRLAAGLVHRARLARSRFRQT